MKVMLYNHANFAYFLIEALKYAKNKNVDIDWQAIVVSENFVKLYQESIGEENTFYIQPILNKLMRDQQPDIGIFKDYPESIYKALHRDKQQGKLRRSSREYQIKYVYNVYALYKKILDDAKPDFVFFPNIESTDAVILYNLCIEKNIEPIKYVWTRSFGLSYFSPDINEKMPPYANSIQQNSEIVKEAKDFISDFRKSYITPSFSSLGVYENDIIPFHDRNLLAKALRYFTRVITKREEHNVSDMGFWGKVKVNCRNVSGKIEAIKARLQKKYLDIRDISDLPKNFLYFPLHVTPEASINVFAPYFYEQMRGIDLILENMPSTFYLVVKEHPIMAGVREASFYRELRKRAGVVIADHTLNSYELIKRAQCTISITGTACLEAFLLGKPSIHLGEIFFTDWIHKFDNFYNFKNTILDAIKEKEIEDSKILDLVTKVFTVGYKFVLFSPGDQWLDTRFLMNNRNKNAFLDSLLDYIDKIKAYRDKRK